jgi:hypothetical protein
MFLVPVGDVDVDGPSGPTFSNHKRPPPARRSVWPSVPAGHASVYALRTWGPELYDACFKALEKRGNKRSQQIGSCRAGSRH